MKRFTGLLIGLMVLVASVASADGPWSLDGTATAVKDGSGPNPWAIQITSTCPTGYPSCLGDGTFTAGAIEFRQPNGKLTFADLYYLATDYIVTAGECTGGAPRFSIGIDVNGDGGFTQPPDGHIFVYLAEPPFSCETSWINTGNVIDSGSTYQYDNTQIGGAYFGDYDQALSLVGDKLVTHIFLVNDTGWSQNADTMLFDNVMVNNFLLNAKGFSKK